MSWLVATVTTKASLIDGVKGERERERDKGRDRSERHR